jgi:hypothetical protein
MQITFPAFPPTAAGDSYTATGRRALLYLLQHGTAASWQLDDPTLAAAADYASVALTAREISGPAIETIAGLQRALRGLQVGRQQAAAAERLQAFGALMATAPAARPAADAVPPADSGPRDGGGSKVPRRPRPSGDAPADALRVPIAALPPVQALQPLALGDDAF